MSYYHGLISSRKAGSLLTRRGDGYFLVRDSQSQPGCFVLTAKSGGRVYHVLIFQEGGQFHLDSAGDQSEEPLHFDSLDDLVVFCIGHNLRVAGDEVQLHEAVACETTSSPLHNAGDSPRRTGSGKSKEEDSDLLTDLFATVFGAHCSVVSVAHSTLNYDGQVLEEGKELLVAIVKDSREKGFFIRMVDPEKKCVVGEKKITKTFQYDMPGELVVTYLSEHGITCVGFHDVREQERFLHQVDRVVRLQQDRAVKLRARADSDNRVIQEGPTGLTQGIKAADFDISNLTPEWEYLFELAGVTRAMLEDPSTLQFILDTVYQLGGEPQKLEHVRQEAVGSDGGSPTHCDTAVQLRRERVQVLAVDHALRRESLRASRLADELEKKSLTKAAPLLKSPGCPYKVKCENFKDHLMLKHSLYALGPGSSTCYCQQCVAGRPVVQVAGSPPQQHTLPVGWCSFKHRSHSLKMVQQFCSHWHVAYCSVGGSRVAGVMRTGQLPHSHSSGEVVLSPDISAACRIASITPLSYHDDITGQNFRVNTAFQVCLSVPSQHVR